MGGKGKRRMKEVERLKKKEGGRGRGNYKKREEEQR